MMAGIRLINSMGLTGLAFAGYDVGGFAGEPTTDLFARWMAIATFSPFFRCHSMINSRDAEPWAFGEEIEEISRNYIKLRYRLLPYIYSIFFEASQSGMPIQRSLVLDYMNDENIFKTEYENEYLFGPWILIAPVSSDKMISKIYLPDGGWYDFFTDKYYEGGKEILIETGKDKIPIFVKQGAVLPIQKPIAHTGADSGDIVEIHLYKGIRNETFTYYEDDGATFGYENNEFYKRKFTLNSKGKTLNISKKDGTYKSKFSKARVFFHGYTKKELFPQLLKNKLDLMKTDYRFVAPVSNFDPFVHSTDDSKVIKNIYYTKIDLVDTEMELRW
jgi:alpha-glucosidase